MQFGAESAPNQDLPGLERVAGYLPQALAQEAQELLERLRAGSISIGEFQTTLTSTIEAAVGDMAGNAARVETDNYPEETPDGTKE